MHLLIKLYKNSQTSFYFLLVVLLLGTLLFLLNEKGDAVTWLNEHRNSVLDVFFLIITQLAEPFVIVICCLSLLILHWRKGVFLVLCILLNTALVQFLKRVVFYDFKRPAYALGKSLDVIPGGDLEVIEGVRLSIDNSFPSGHTMAGATLFLVLSIVSKDKWLKALFILGIPLVATSRVYLAQHYLMDVLAGCFIAVVTCSMYYLFYNRSRLKFI